MPRHRISDVFAAIPHAPQHAQTIPCKAPSRFGSHRRGAMMLTLGLGRRYGLATNLDELRSLSHRKPGREENGGSVASRRNTVSAVADILG